jgi:hypothetical protein
MLHPFYSWGFWNMVFNNSMYKIWYSFGRTISHQHTTKLPYPTNTHTSSYILIRLTKKIGSIISLFTYFIYYQISSHNQTNSHLENWNFVISSFDDKNSNQTQRTIIPLIHNSLQTINPNTKCSIVGLVRWWILNCH